ncbi:MAG: ATP citrate lyase citrate-binding domain-containing protein, partial [Desulfosalsimonas sp.]
RYEFLHSQTDFERKAAEIDNLDHRGVAGRVIEFDGNLGLIIGGGGASLTAFDAIRAHGGKPANYCEIGGNPSVKKVKELTRHILSKPGVEQIAVIMNVVSNTRVDLVARGIIKGILEAGRKPLETVAVFRVPGAWEEEGVKILKKYGVRYCDRKVSIDQAAEMAVAQGSEP